LAKREEPLVLLDNVRLTLTGGGGPVEVLKGVDLTLEAGRTLSVLGPSGAGKTTMLMVIAGLEKATAGRVRVAGRELGELNEDQLARFRRGRVGVVFQAFHLVPTMTARENVALPLELAGGDQAWDRAAEALGRVGLRERLNHYPSQLSGGEQQRVAIARAFAPEPSLLLADEPTGNLDDDTGSRVADLLFSLQETSGSAMLLITHNAALAARAARRVQMRDGRVANCHA
jgi:putative ABC transport system ATP-binding protein